MRVFVTGCQGRLGKYLVDNLGYHPLECDVTDIASVKVAIREHTLYNELDTIIHCAAFTDVDDCEGAGYDKALKVNVRGTCNIRTAFRGQIIYLSTDYVFDGRDGPYSEEAEPNPQCHYGMTKLYGEEEILEADYPRDVILRTTVLYGGHKPDFVTAILEKLKTNELFEVTGALLGSPTYVPHLAKGIKKLVMLKQPPRIVNIVGRDVITRWVFACNIAKVFGYPIHNVLLTMVGQTGAALRPRLAGLKVDLARTLNIPIYSVQDGLEEMRG
jgi:dTDP-4-dehydrorhamnose reductase